MPNSRSQKEARDAAQWRDRNSRQAGRSMSQAASIKDPKQRKKSMGAARKAYQDRSYKYHSRGGY
jgi:hypothetical protein